MPPLPPQPLGQKPGLQGLRTVPSIWRPLPSVTEIRASSFPVPSWLRLICLSPEFQGHLHHPISPLSVAGTRGNSWHGVSRGGGEKASQVPVGASALCMWKSLLSPGARRACPSSEALSTRRGNTDSWIPSPGASDSESPGGDPGICLKSALVIDCSA